MLLDLTTHNITQFSRQTMEEIQENTEPPPEPVKENEEPPPEPIKIMFLPQSFVDEMKRRQTENDYTLEQPLKTKDFLEQLEGDPDFGYNQFQIWIHRTITEWYQALLQEGSPFEAREQYVSLLLFYLLTDFIGNAQQEHVQLQDFFDFLDARKLQMHADHEAIGWFCLLSVLNPKMGSIASSVNTLKKSSRKSRTSSTLRSKTSSGSDTRHRFASQITFLENLLRSSFSYKFHFEILRQAVCNSFVWNEIRCGDHRVQAARPYQPKEKGKDKKRPTTAGTINMSSAFTDQTSPEELLLNEQRRFILPLNLATNMGNNFWPMLFDPQT